MYPVPFAKPSDILPTALLCERLGFDSVWGNDHMTTQRYVRKEFSDPPNFFEPLITFSYCAARTTTLRFATGIIVLPMRNMPVLAKQVATLDQLAGGRVILGVGTGAYREEYEALFPDARDVRRGTIVDEGMQALRLLFTERRATFRGRAVHFEDVECFPKPVQNPMPIYAGVTIPRYGAAPGSTRRAGCPRSCRPRRSSGAWPMSIGPRPRPDGTGRRSTSRRSSRSRSGVPTTRRSGASEPRSSSSISSR